MRVFVTGGSGFVGGHLIERLVHDGHAVVAMARSDRSASIVAGYGAEPARCDLDRVGPTHLDGCDAVIHAAAHVEEHGDRETFWRINVEGTVRLLDAARRAKVRRFVHVGTEAILLDDTRDLLDVDEQVPPPKRHRFLYSETKAEAERRVLEASRDDFVALCVRPRLVWGPRDETILPALARMVDAGSFAWIDGGRALSSTTHVANLVHALVLALDAGVGGHAYFVADDGARTLREVLTAFAATRGLELPNRSIPSWVARPTARALERVWKLARLGGPAPITPFAVCVMSRSVTVRTERARRELGYAPVIDFESGVKAMG